MPCQPVAIGLIVGNRGFFPAQLCESGRQTMLEVLAKAGFRVVPLGAKATRYGSSESQDEARLCAALLDENRHKLDGVIITLPNFGDERAIANALRWAIQDNELRCVDASGVGRTLASLPADPRIGCATKSGAGAASR